MDFRSLKFKKSSENINAHQCSSYGKNKHFTLKNEAFQLQKLEFLENLTHDDKCL